MRLATGILGLLLAAALAACRGDTVERAAGERPPSSFPGGGDTAATSVTGERVDPAELSREGARWVGRVVTLEAPVKDTPGSAAIAVGDESVGEGFGLLVVVPRRTQPLPVGGRVTVTGEVMLYDEARLQSGYGWIAATPEIESRYGGKPVVVAQSIRTPDGREIVGPPDRSRPATGEQP